MAELINLGRARKAKARIEREAQAAANRVKSGRTTARKRTEKAEADRAARALDQAKRDD